ncbi:hypothetical protein SEVIR_8G159433v4 [Setaria viridis]
MAWRELTTRSLTDVMDRCDVRVVVMVERTYAANAPPADARTWDLVRFVLTTSRRSCSSDFLRSKALCSVMSCPAGLQWLQACILQSFCCLPMWQPARRQLRMTLRNQMQDSYPHGLKGFLFWCLFKVTPCMSS